MKYIFAIWFAVMFSATATAGCNSKSLNGKWRVYFTDLTSASIITCKLGTTKIDACTFNGETYTNTKDIDVIRVINKDCSFTVTGITLTAANKSDIIFDLDGQISQDKLSIVGRYTMDINANPQANPQGSFSGLKF